MRNPSLHVLLQEVTESRLKTWSWCKCNKCIQMATAEECICCCEVSADQHISSLQKEVDCLTECQQFQMHVNPGILETFFKTNKKNWKKNNIPKGPGRKLSNE